MSSVAALRIGERLYVTTQAFGSFMTIITIGSHRLARDAIVSSEAAL